MEIEVENPSVDFFLQKLVAELEDVRKDRSELLYHNEILRKELQLKLDNKEVIETVEVQQLKAETLRLSVENTYLQAQLDESKKILGTEDLSGLQNQIDLLTAQLATAESNAAEFKETVGRKLTATKAELNVVKSEKAKLNAELMKSKAENIALSDRVIRLQNRIDLADSEAKDLLREMFSTQAALEQKLRVKDNDIEAKTVQLAELQRQLTEQKITHESRLDLHQSELEEVKFKLSTVNSLLNSYKEQLRSQEMAHTEELDNLNQKWSDRLKISLSKSV